MAEQLLILRPGLGKPRDVFLGDDQDVNGRFGIDVAERQHRLVLIDNVGRDFARDDFLENILAHNALARRAAPRIVMPSRLPPNGRGCQPCARGGSTLICLL